MNLGNAISGASTAGIYLSTDSTITTSDTLLATVNSGTLATVSQPGYYDHQTLSVTLPANLAPGTYYIGGIADYNNAVTESNSIAHTYNAVQITVPVATTASLSNLSVTAAHDSFVFAPNFGQATIANFNPATDTIQFSQAVFANLDALLAAAHDDGHGNVIISDAAHDTLTIQNMNSQQLHAHQSDFHIV
jgi:hypothetical protein